MRGARRDGSIEPAFRELIRFQIDLELSDRNPVEAIRLFDHADVLEYEPFTRLTRERPRVPEQPLLEQLIVARVVLERGEE